jgi:hypothetical protein
LIGESTNVRPIYVKSPVSLSLNPRVHPCVCGCIHEDTFFPIPPGGFNHCAEVDVEAWPYFPGLKVGKFISIPFGGGLNRDIVRITIIPELCG